LFADLGARILVGDVRAGAVVTWVSSLDGDGVMGQLTISQRPCHRTWHGRSPSFAELHARILIGIIGAGAAVTWARGAAHHFPVPMPPCVAWAPSLVCCPRSVSVGTIRVMTWQWAKSMAVKASGRPIADVVERRQW